MLPRRVLALRGPVSATIALLLALLSHGAAAAEPALASASAPHATEPGIYPSPIWLVTQLLPSPEWYATSSGVHFGVRWQVTPFLYSFAMNRKLSPLRAFVVEPVIRHGGSVELFASPEYIAVTPTFGENWLFRGGIRAYSPLAHRGEYLSCSIGGSLFYFRDHVGAAYEAGLYTLGGIFGLQVTYTPTAEVRGATFTLSIRYF